MPPARRSFFSRARSRAFGRAAQFLASYADWDDFWFSKDPAAVAGYSGNRAAGPVSPETALRLSAVWACLGILTEGLAGLPLLLYRRLENGGKERAINHPLYWLLNFQPNPWQTRFEFEEMALGHVLLRGNFYARIIEEPETGIVLRLIPLHPDRMRLTWDPSSYEITYWYTPQSGPEEPIPARFIHHRRGRTFDGLYGVTPITYSSSVVAMAQADQNYAQQFFNGAGVPTFALKTPKILGPTGQKNLRESVDQYRAGGKFIILEEGLDVATLGISPKDVQLLDLRQFDIEEIARLFNVPLHKLKVNKPGTVSYASVEMFDIEFIQHSLRPWAVRFEQSIWRDLLSDREQGRYVPEYLLDAILRGDSNARSAYFTRALNPQSGWMTKNEVRLLEGRNPMDGGDDLPSAKAPAPAPAADPGVEEPLPGDDERDPRGRPRGQAIIREAAARVHRREVLNLQKAAKQLASTPEGWAVWLRGFYLDPGAEYQRCLRESLCVTDGEAARLAALRHGALSQAGALVAIEATAGADIEALAAAAALEVPLLEELLVP